MATFHMAVIQFVLSYGVNSLTINDRNWKPFNSFHKKTERQLTKAYIQKYGDGS